MKYLSVCITTFHKKPLYFLFFVVFSFLLHNNKANAQNCNCTEYLYVNDTGLDEVHKFELNPATGALTEVTADGTPRQSGEPAWLENINNPHGGVFDVNGRLYFGERGSNSNNIDEKLIKVTCTGEKLDELFVNGLGDGAFTNFVTDGNILYVNGWTSGSSSSIGRVRAFNLCTERLIGSLDYDPGSTNWELFEASDGLMYTYPVNTDLLNIFQVPYDTLQYGSGVTLDPFLETELDSEDFGYWGMDTDDAGNWYVLVEYKPNGNAEEFRIYKLNPDGTINHFITDTALDANPQGWWDGIGVQYSPASNMLYVSSELEDCVSVIDLSDPNQMEYKPNLSIPFVPGGAGKDLALTTECCPQPSEITIDTTLCAASINDVLYLQELFPCNGVICEGVWSPVGNIEGLEYTECDNSVKITGTTACGTFELASDGTAANARCGEFKITLKIEVENVSDAVIEAPDDPTCATNNDPDPITVTTPATGTGDVTYTWQSSTTSCTEGFTDIAGAPTDGSAYDPGVITQETYFRLISTVNGTCSSGACSDTSNCVILTPEAGCTPVCVTPDAGEDAEICQPKSTLKLKDAPTGTEWVVSSGNATIDAATGAITGMTGIGTYTFMLRSTADNSCSDDIVVTVTANTPHLLCNDGSTSITANADAGLTDIVWFNSAGTQVGTGSSLTITSNTAGLDDAEEWFYYTAKDANDCDVELCCPVVVRTEDCCPTPNCLTVTVIKN